MLKFIRNLFSPAPASSGEDDVERSRQHQKLGNVLLAEAKFVEAAHAFRQAIDANPDQVDGYINLGYALSELKQYHDAQQILAKAVAIDPANVDGLYMLATLSRTLGDITTAISTLDHLLALRPDFEIAYAELCDLLLGSQQLERAKSVIIKGIAHFPASGQLHNIFGTILATTGAYDQASASFAAAIRLQPDYAGLHFSLGSVLQAQGKLEDAVTSYRRAVSFKPDYFHAQANLGTSLLGLQQNKAALSAFDCALKCEPGHFDMLINKSTALLGLKRYDEALVLCDQILATQSDRAEVFTNHGIALKNLGRYEEALSSYERGHLLKPSDSSILINRANVLQRLNRHQEALNCLDQALVLSPVNDNIFLSHGASLLGLYRHQEALCSWTRAVEINPDCADAHYNESLCRLQLGDFERGWPKHEWRWKTEQFGKTQRRFQQPRWSGKESLVGKTILLHPEQGLGDTIQFSRYAKTTAEKGATVILMVQPPLKALLADLDGVAHIVTTDDPLPIFDYHCALLSLPHVFGTRFDSGMSGAAYIKADGDRAQAWAARLGRKSKPRIGLVWSGNTAHSNDHNRSMPLSAFINLLTGDAQFFSLQKELRTDDADILAQHPEIRHFGEEFKSFADTAGLISQMDLVISVDTSVAHLAGAMGTPLWILLPASSDWRWFLDRDDSPWYQSVKLFRQSIEGDMNEVIDTVAEALRDFIQQAR